MDAAVSMNSWCSALFAMVLDEGRNFLGTLTLVVEGNTAADRGGTRALSTLYFINTFEFIA